MTMGVSTGIFIFYLELLSAMLTLSSAGTVL
jgi:hypothetical protein